MMTEDGIEVDQCRAALQKMLDNEIFAGSRRLCDFCRYCGNAALEGRADLTQYEIAEKVLGRAINFNPWDDAAVRKLATQLRHKLDAYYAGPGESDPIVISMPRRSYLLRFRKKEQPVDAIVESSAQQVPESGPAPHPPSDHPIRPSASGLRPHWLWALAGVLVGATPALVWLLLPGRWAPGGSTGFPACDTLRVTIDTQRGDVRGRVLDVAPEAVRLGPELGDGEEATVRLRFTPQSPTQQAGLMVLYDADNYIRLGPHYKNRALMEFGVEHDGAYQGPASTYEFDPMGQAGLPRWLTLRRSGTSYTAYLSSDGFAWRQFGGGLTLPDTSGDLKTAIYAFNGRSNNSSARAIFEHFGTGLAFHSRPEGPFQVSAFPAWDLRDDCKVPASANVTGGVLQVGFNHDAVGCQWLLTRAVPAGDWAISALVDFEATSGSAFGLVVSGSKSSIALSRRDLAGGSLLLQRNDDNDTRLQDYPGNPPIALRLEKRGAVIRASVSRDLESFTPLPGEVKAAELGEVRRIGVVASIAHWTSQVSRPPARIYWVRVEPIVPGFLTRGNVP